jgi:cytochrome c553
VQETNMVPKTKVQGNVYFVLEGAAAGTEPIGNRIIEVPEFGQERFELRDDHAGYIAYAPVGSIRKGEQLAAKLQCGICHGPNLEGVGPVPPLAGRSPSYLARQLFDFQTGMRRGLWTDLMKPIVAKMTAEDLVNIAAYMASKRPTPPAVRQTARVN